MSWERYHDASTHPPAIESAGDAVPPWILLDNQAYLAGGSNRTTAISSTRDSDEVQATFFLVAPPLVSYLSVSCASKFGTEPRILCTEASLILLAFLHGDPSKITDPEKHDFYVYDVGAESLSPFLLPLTTSKLT
jgi:hypothetical protein